MENEKNTIDESVVEETEEIEVEEIEVEEVSQTDILNEKLADAEDKYLRLQAEFKNYKNRVEKEKSSLIKYSHGEVIKNILPVIDNFERAMASSSNSEVEVESLLEGIELIKKSFDEFLENSKVELVKTVGEKFDTQYHHAVMKEKSDEFDHNVVIEEFQKGYVLEGKVIRHAMVKVASNK